RRVDGTWRLTLEDQRDATRFEFSARALVTAGGPWVSEVISETAGLNVPTRVRLVKGSHIVVDRVFEHDRAYIFQNADRRVCFAIPYEHDFTLIGTTDEDYVGDPAVAAISEHETDYLLAAVSQYLERPITRAMIRWTYAGVRPLFDDGATKAQEATRDYVLQLDAPAGKPPLLSIIGGKITTYRRLAEHALEELAGTFPEMRPPWTRAARLPGGDVPVTSFGEWTEGVAHRFAFLGAALVGRFCRAYGSRVDTLLAGVSAATDLGRDLGAGLTEREVDYLVAHEWAETADDILWRRSKLGLRFTPDQRAALAGYLRSSDRNPQRAAVGGSRS
ncbi:MAG: glycerol-3-phosphate dehydrogenase, partial [Bauldia sp.]